MLDVDFIFLIAGEGEIEAEELFFLEGSEEGFVVEVDGAVTLAKDEPVLSWGVLSFALLEEGAVGGNAGSWADHKNRCFRGGECKGWSGMVKDVDGCEYEDMIKGRITCPWSEVDDQILLKSDGFPTYHLANVVDDYLMKITHIIRGDEWMTSTPKHVLLYDLFGWERPSFMHMPLLLGQNGKKLSKRKNPTSIFYYKESGYLPEAFVNFLSLMGYSMPEDREIYTLDEIIKDFSLKRVGVSGAFFDVKKLDWLNQHYLINSIPEKDLWAKIREWGFSDERMEKIIPLVHTRIKTFGEFMELCSFLFITHIELNEELLTPKGIDKTQAVQILQGMILSMEKQENWKRDGFDRASRDVAEFFEVNHKKIVMRILFATITGKHQGPPLFDSIEILGKDLTRARLLNAIEFLGGISNKKLAELTKRWA